MSAPRKVIVERDDKSVVRLDPHPLCGTENHFQFGLYVDIAYRADGIRLGELLKDIGGGDFPRPADDDVLLLTLDRLVLSGHLNRTFGPRAVYTAKRLEVIA